VRTIWDGKGGQREIDVCFWGEKCRRFVVLSSWSCERIGERLQRLERWRTDGGRNKGINSRTCLPLIDAEVRCVKVYEEEKCLLEKC